MISNANDCLGMVINNYTLHTVLDCIARYMHRFDRNSQHRLAAALELPDFYRCEQGTKATGMEVLLIMLRRLSYPMRWCDLAQLFGREESELSMIFNLVSLLACRVCSM